MAIEIRSIQTQEEYRAVEQMQQKVWGLDALGTVPHHLLLTAQKSGGVLVGAFDTAAEMGGRLVGFVFGFVGLAADGRVKHCSHMAGVHPGYQNRGLGYRLKLAQRERLLDQGIDLVTWTFGPLESRNAYLNFRKLGAICRIYQRDMYGEMNSLLHVGLSTDRFEVEWPIASERVARRVVGNWQGPSVSALRDAGVPVVNRVVGGDLPRPVASWQAMEGDRLLVQIPSDFQGIKATDMALARAWRLHTRGLFEAVFARGYTITDLIFEAGRSFYLLEAAVQS